MSVTPASPISRRLITEQILARLQLLEDDGTDTSVYDGEVPDQPPTVEDNPTRIAPYVVLFPSPGAPIIDQADLGGENLDLTLTYQLHAAAGWRMSCEDLIDRVHALLFRWSPTLAGYGFGWMQPPPGYDPGPIRRADQPAAQAPRFWSPLQYQLQVTR